MDLSESASPRWIWRMVGFGGCAVLGLWVIGLLLGALFVPLRQHGQAVTCQSNVFRLTRAQLLYADDYDDHIPLSDRWMDRVLPYVLEDRRYHCPSVSIPGENRFGYAMNGQLGDAIRGKLIDPDNQPLIYDSSNLAKSPFDSFTSLPQPGRHNTRERRGSPERKGNFVGYAGGSARILTDDERAKSITRP